MARPVPSSEFTRARLRRVRRDDAEVRTESDTDDSEAGSDDAATIVDGIRAMQDGEFVTVEELREAEGESRE